MLRTLFVFTIVVLAWQSSPRAWAADPPAADAGKEKPYGNVEPGATTTEKPAPQLSQEELEKQFAETMTGATLMGFFTHSSKAGEGAAEAGKPDANRPMAPLKPDRYTLGKVSKMKDDYWLIEARIQYEKHDFSLPLTVRVKWAGDTPVITLTDLTIPGFGTFTSRVLMFRGQYAGTWAHDDRGGQLFGKIIPAEKK